MNGACSLLAWQSRIPKKENDQVKEKQKNQNNNEPKERKSHKQNWEHKK